MLGLMLVCVSGCQKNIAATDSFCLIYKPVYTSRLDTEQTRQQVTDNNVAYESICK